MWAIIHCLKTWGHYIGSKDVVVWTNNVTLKYFATQPKLSSKQMRWQDTLACSMWTFDISPGRRTWCLMLLVENTNLKWCMWGKQNFKSKFD
jgi:hypothetical protein